MNRLILPALALLLTGTVRAADRNPFAEGVRTTEPLTPERQLKSFRPPPGFQVQLVAAEPDLRKPMNMAWDAAGRLWVTESREYPFAATNAATARDTIRIFADFDTNGRARSVTTFATNLNIPIGLYPFRSSARSVTGNRKSEMTWKCVAWSIPNIWLFEDTDGDGRADRQEKLYGPFDASRDTHGNQASFRRGLDGWVYATHGFNNQSRVKGTDGHEIFLPSGNVYRFRLDGSRIEHWTHGQVNPFGLAFDPLGNLFSADCHSSPIYQLLRGAHYPSFGRPHDGLGFGPTTIQHSHGSTAIAGIVHVSDPAWPAEFQDNLLIGNVMTSRINRDRLEWRGSTSVGHELPDFLTCDDPWFRPVDLQWGPDGALYVADFYNRIIGHYEVPLNHPGRDRERGRIWRIVPPGGSDVRRLKRIPNETAATPRNRTADLVTELGSENPARRMLALRELTDTVGTNAVETLKETARGIYDFPTPEAKSLARVHALWALLNLHELDDTTMLAFVEDSAPLVRTHLMRILTEYGLRLQANLPGSMPPADVGNLRALLLLHATDTNAHVQRAAIEALSLHPDMSAMKLLVDLMLTTPETDTHLRHATRLALRDHLAVDALMRQVTEYIWTDRERTELISVALAVPSEPAAQFLLANLERVKADAGLAQRILEHASRHGSPESLVQLAAGAQARIPKSYGRQQYLELARQFDLFRSMDDGWKQRGGPLPPPVIAWGTNLVRTFFRALDTYHSWEPSVFAPAPTATPWDTQPRSDTDGKTRALTSSHPHGEQLTGVLRSPPFPCPDQLLFWLCGHNGFPNQPDHHKNAVRLRAVGTMQVLAEAFPPRSDTARQVIWKLSGHKDKPVFVEATDGDDARAYAWLAFGDFEPRMSQLRPSEFQPRAMRDWMLAALDLVRRLRITELAPFLARQLGAGDSSFQPDQTDAELSEAGARTWLVLEPDAAVPGLARRLTDPACPAPFRERLGTVLAESRSAVALAAVGEAFKFVPTRVQQQWARTLAEHRAGAQTLLTAAERGQVARSLLGLTGLQNRIQSAAPRAWKARLGALTRDLPAGDEARARLIARRRQAYHAARPDAANGKAVFDKACAACHQFAGHGALVGPQLDGIGARGLERLLEDILDPNRNVDPAFRATVFILSEGETINGLFRREEGATIVYALANGQEARLPKADVRERRETQLSLMPENFADLLTAAELNDLLAWLLQTQSK